MVFGRDTTNLGTICAGAGGDVLGSSLGQAGKGGDAHIWGKWGGAGTLINHGLACGGDGGAGDPGATSPQQGGDGGRLKLISLPSVFLDGGQHRAGLGGQGSGGGADGRDGQVIIEPNTISLAGSDTRVQGGDILIFGGQDWILDLAGMSTAAISATGSITLAVGAGGAVDLSGNATQILQASGPVVIASDAITLDAGISLSSVVGSDVITLPGQVLNDFSLLGPAQMGGRAGQALPISLTLLNSGPATDTYSLAPEAMPAWTLTGLPSFVTVGGLEVQEFALSVQIPATAHPGDTGVVTITATSQNDPALAQAQRVEISVRSAVYLPIVLKRG
jgi:hypothetical protein